MSPRRNSTQKASSPTASQGCCTIPLYTSGQKLVCQEVSSERDCKSAYDGTWTPGKCPEMTKAYGTSLMGVRNCGCSDDFPLCEPLRTKASLQELPYIVVDQNASKAKLFAQYLKKYGAEGDKLLTKTGSLEGVKNFNATVDFIEKTQAEQPNAVLAINEYAVLSKKDLDKLNGFSLTKLKSQLKTRAPPPPIPASTKASLTEILPNNFVWSMKGVVGIAKDQGNCGSCYVFSALATIESGYTRRTGKMLVFSEKALMAMKDNIKCKNLLDDGCDRGGLPQDVIQCVVNTGGYVTVENRDKKEEVQTGVTGVGTVLITNSKNSLEQIEMEIMKALFKNGPLCVAVGIDDKLWPTYAKGILQSPKRKPTQKCQRPQDPACHLTELNHAVVLIGWGSEIINGAVKKFWVIRNSWGMKGELGAVRLERGNPDDKTGPFRMYEFDPVYPIFST